MIPDVSAWVLYPRVSRAALKAKVQLYIHVLRALETHHGNQPKAILAIGNDNGWVNQSGGFSDGSLREPR
jgi:hypothetical protein